VRKGYGLIQVGVPEYPNVIILEQRLGISLKTAERFGIPRPKPLSNARVNHALTRFKPTALFSQALANRQAHCG